LWIIVELVVLAGALSRKDLEPVTKLTWIVVIILVPVFGVFFYWFIAPAPPWSTRGSGTVAGNDYQDENYQNQPTECIKCKTTIPAGATVCPKCGWSYLKGG
ncbi:MAG TPA: PLDc N-terminal domain-containing protein, partial [Verrucomicrobiae bacterium]